MDPSALLAARQSVRCNGSAVGGVMGARDGTTIGRRSPTDLETVAESIISQWKGAGSGAG
jgi:hypothetical protein